MTVTVRQWQVDWLGWPSFADVPYVLGCNPHGNNTQRSFTECGVTRSQVIDAKPARAPSSTTFQLQLTQAVTSPYPSSFALLSGPSLLPDGLPTYNRHNGSDVLDERSNYSPAATWMALCNGATSGPCAVSSGDVDSDGIPDGMDCRRTNNSTIPAGSVYFLATEQPLGAVPDRFSIDANCDGWPTPVMVEFL